MEGLDLRLEKLIRMKKSIDFDLARSLNDRSPSIEKVKLHVLSTLSSMLADWNVFLDVYRLKFNDVSEMSNLPSLEPIKETLKGCHQARNHLIDSISKESALLAEVNDKVQTAIWRSCSEIRTEVKAVSDRRKKFGQEFTERIHLIGLMFEDEIETMREERKLFLTKYDQGIFR